MITLDPHPHLPGCISQGKTKEDAIGNIKDAIEAYTSGLLVRNGHDVSFHDLYLERFDPILPGSEIPKGAPIDPAVQMHCDEIAAAEGIMIVHPNWWGQPPAILKGWIDRVIRPGLAYEFLEGGGGEGVPIGLLKAKTALIFNTPNTPEVREMEIFGDPRRSSLEELRLWAVWRWRRSQKRRALWW